MTARDWPVQMGNVEALEPRLLLAGDISVRLVDGCLWIVGDAAANAITVDQAGLADGQFRLTGQDGTTINGLDQELLFDNVQAIRIFTGDGDDTVALQSTQTAVDVQVDLGNGNDTLKLTNGVAGNLRAMGGEGRDEITFENFAAAVATIRTGPGADVLRIDDIEALSRLVARMGAGPDTIKFTGPVDVDSMAQRHDRIIGGLGRDDANFAGFLHVKSDQEWGFLKSFRRTLSDGVLPYDPVNFISGYGRIMRGVGDRSFYYLHTPYGDFIVDVPAELLAHIKRAGLDSPDCWVEFELLFQPGTGHDSMRMAKLISISQAVDGAGEVVPFRRFAARFTEAGLFGYMPPFDVIRSQEELANLGIAPLTEVDFENEMVIGVFRGWCSSSGFNVEVLCVKETEDSIVVYAGLRNPAPDEGVLMSLTYPYEMIVVPRSDKPVRYEFSPAGAAAMPQLQPFRR